MRPGLMDLLHPTLDEDPRRVALRAAGALDCRFDDVFRIVETAGGALRGAGAGAGARIATILPNAPETALCILTLSTSATCVPVNPASPPAEVARLLSDADVSHVVCAGGRADELTPLLGERVGLLELQPEPGPAGAFRLRVLRDGRAATPSPAENSPALVLHTSGSTGQPKRVPLTVANLRVSALSVAASLTLGRDDTSLSMMPMFHIGALVDLLLAPLSVGGSVAFASEISTAGFFSALHAFHPTWSQAVPTVLRDLLAHEPTSAEREAMAGLRFIRAVSQALPQQLQDRFEARYGVPLIPMFGMTETAGLITSMPLTAPRQGSVGVTFGADIRISDQYGNELQPMERGEVLVAGANVMGGYEGEGDRSEAFRGRWLRTGDEGYVDQDGYLFLTGRLKEVINRGGEKISPSEIDLLLAGHDGLKEAAAFSVPHPSLGEEVGVAVVPVTGRQIPESEIIGWLRARLAEHKVPRRVVFLEQLPRLPSGKLDRRTLALTAGATEDEVGRRTAPATPLARSIAAMWRKTLAVDEIAMEDDFFDLGGDSLTATTLSMELETRFGQDLPIAELFDTPTLARMEQVLAGRIEVTRPATDLEPEIYSSLQRITAGWQGKRRPGSLVVGRNTLGTKRPFFWVPQSLHGFEALARCLEPERPLYAMTSLSLTGHRTKENTRRLARYYAQEIAEIQPEGPYLIGGFCQGGVVALEIARALRSHGQEVDLLCLQDRFVPEPYDGETAFFWGRRGQYCAYDLNHTPERAWSKFYSGPVSVFVSDADHTQLHNEPFVTAFARQLEAEFERVEQGRPPSQACRFKPQPPLDPRAFDCRVRTRVPLLLEQGARHVLTVEVENRSELDWQPTESSGLIVAARWRVLDFDHPFLFDGVAELSRAVPSRTAAVVELPIRVPMRSLPMFLDIDLVEDGAYYGEAVRPARFRRPVLPFRKSLTARYAREAS